MLYPVSKLNKNITKVNSKIDDLNYPTSYLNTFNSSALNDPSSASGAVWSDVSGAYGVQLAICKTNAKLYVRSLLENVWSDWIVK